MEKIGKYEILDKIGSGGFAVVYKGRDPFIKRLVAIKVCYSRDENTRERFYREAEIAGQLVHRNITTVYDFGLQGEMPYLVEEYLSGEDLAHAIDRREPSTLEEKLDCLLQIASGLGHAHSHGVMHRDIKPSNVRLLDSGRVKIMDFGTAKLAHVESHLTQAGITLGTVAYLSPERLQGHQGALNSDIFSFGVLAYELLSFRRPFAGRSIPALIEQLINANPVPLTQSWPECPPLLAEIVHKCLRKDPEERYTSCAQMTADLEKFQREHSGTIVRSPAPQVPPAADVGQPAIHGVEIQLKGLLDRARHHLEQGRHPRAEVLLEEVVELDPANTEARELLAQATSAVPTSPAPAVAESTEQKRERKIAEAVASIEGYLEVGELARVGAALRFAHHLLGDFDQIGSLGRRAVQVYREQLANLRGEALRHAENVVEKATAALAADRLSTEIAHRWAAWVEDLDPGNPDIERLHSAIEGFRRRRRQDQEVEEREARQAEAVASIERYLGAGHAHTAQKALEFAIQMFGEFEGAAELRRKIEHGLEQHGG